MIDGLTTTNPISAPFGIEDASKRLTADFLKNGIGDTIGENAEVIDRHTMNGIGYLMTIGVYLNEINRIPLANMASFINGYPMGAIKAIRNENGDLREYICNGDNTLSEPPFTDTIPPSVLKNGWLPTKGWWNTVFTPFYYAHFYSSGGQGETYLGSITRADEESHTRQISVVNGGWVKFTRSITRWNNLSESQRKSRNPCCQIFIIQNEARKLILSIPFFGGETVKKMIPIPSNVTLELFIDGYYLDSPPAQDHGTIKGFGSMSLSASLLQYDKMSRR